MILNIFLLTHVLFQNFYLWKKDKKSLKEMKDRDKEILIKVRKRTLNSC